MDNDKVFWECGKGWNDLIKPLIARADLHGSMVMQIKEKFGKLRFYFDPGLTEDGTLDDMVDQAEADSAHVCEMCGRPGRLRIKGGWLKTLCPEDAINLSYKEDA